MEEKIKKIMSEILEIPEKKITDEFGPDDGSNWDSLSNLQLITALESEFGIKLSMEDIRSMVNFRIIKEIIKSYSTFAPL